MDREQLKQNLSNLAAKVAEAETIPDEQVEAALQEIEDPETRAEVARQIAPMFKEAKTMHEGILAVGMMQKMAEFMREYLDLDEDISLEYVLKLMANKA